MNPLDTFRIAWQRRDREQAPLGADGARRADRRRRRDHPGRGRHRLVAGGAEPDQPARHEHDHRAQPRPLRSRPGDDGHAVADRVADEPRRSRRSRIRTRRPTSLSVSPVISTTETATFGAATLLGVRDRHDAVLPDGRGLHASRPAARSRPADVTNRRRVVLVGQTVVSNLFATGQNPLGQTIQIGSASFTDRRRARREGHVGHDEPGQRRDRALHGRAGRADRASRRRSASCSCRRSRRER